MCAGCGCGGSGAGEFDRPGDGDRSRKLGTLGIGLGIAPAEVGESDRVTSVGRPATGLGEAITEPSGCLSVYTSYAAHASKGSKEGLFPCKPHPRHPFFINGGAMLSW